MHEKSKQALNSVEWYVLFVTLIFTRSWPTPCSLFNNSSYSDVTIHLGTHRIVLAMYSPLLNDVFSKKPETDIGFLLNDYSAHSYWRVFHYMYKQMYTVETTEVLGAAGE